MLRIYTCITQDHDLRLVVLAGLICLFACYTGFSLITRASGAAQRARLSWLLGAAFSLASGVWATHFVAMLAFQPKMPVGYDIDFTLLSIVIAMIFAAIGLLIATGEGRARRLVG